LSAEPDALLANAGSRACARHLNAIGSAFRLVLLKRIRRGPLLTNGNQLHDYLNFVAAHGRIESIRVLYLNSRHELLRDDLLSQGTTNEASLSVRSILKRALELDAHEFLVVHNHPSGDPTPSRGDKEITRQLAAGARSIGLILVDHIVVARGQWVSFREQMLL
jgi:DNA repair protein RadC